MSGNFCIDADGGGVGAPNRHWAGHPWSGSPLSRRSYEGWVLGGGQATNWLAVYAPCLLLPSDHRPLGCSQEYCNMQNLFPGACRGGGEVAGPAHHKQRCPSTSYTFRAAGGDAFSLILTIIPPYLETHPEKPPCRRCCGYASRAVGT